MEYYIHKVFVGLSLLPLPPYLTLPYINLGGTDIVSQTLFAMPCHAMARRRLMGARIMTSLQRAYIPTEYMVLGSSPGYCVEH